MPPEAEKRVASAARGAGRGAPPALAAGAADRSTSRLLLSRADQSSSGGDEFSRDLQRSHRRAHHAVRARVRAGLPQQMRREYLRRPQDTGVIHLPEATALILGVG